MVDGVAHAIVNAGLGRPAAAAATGELLHAATSMFDELVESSQRVFGTAHARLDERTIQLSVDPVAIVHGSAGRAVADAWQSASQLLEEAALMADVAADPELVRRTSLIRDAIRSVSELTRVTVDTFEQRVLDGIDGPATTVPRSAADLSGMSAKVSAGFDELLGRRIEGAAVDARAALRLVEDAPDRVAAFESIREIASRAMQHADALGDEATDAERIQVVGELARAASEIDARWIATMSTGIGESVVDVKGKLHVDSIRWTRSTDAAIVAHESVGELLERASQVVPERSLEHAAIRRSLASVREGLAATGETIDRAHAGGRKLVEMVDARPRFYGVGDDIHFMRVIEMRADAQVEVPFSVRRALRDAFEIHGTFSRNARVRANPGTNLGGTYWTLESDASRQLQQLVVQARELADGARSRSMLGDAARISAEDVLARVRATYGSADGLRDALAQARGAAT